MSDERDDELHPVVDRLFDGVQPTPGVDVGAALEAVTARAATVRRLRRVRRIGAVVLVAVVLGGGATVAVVASGDKAPDEVVASDDPSPGVGGTLATTTSTASTSSTATATTTVPGDVVDACPDLVAEERDLPPVYLPALPIEVVIGTSDHSPPEAPAGASTPIEIRVLSPEADPSWQDEATIDRWDGSTWVPTYSLHSLFGGAPGIGRADEAAGTDDGPRWRETAAALPLPSDAAPGIYRLSLTYEYDVGAGRPRWSAEAHVVFGVPCPEPPPTTTSAPVTDTITSTASTGPTTTAATVAATTASPTTSSSDPPTATTITPPPEGSGPARWELAPGEAVDAATTSFVANVTELTCSSGRSADGRVLAPDIVVSADRIVVTFRVAPATTATSAGDPPTTVTCPSNPPSNYTVTLPEPLGDRVLVDGDSGEPRAG
jgi:hypothetical protein